MLKGFSSFTVRCKQNKHAPLPPIFPLAVCVPDMSEAERGRTPFVFMARGFCEYTHVRRVQQCMAGRSRACRGFTHGVCVRGGRVGSCCWMCVEGHLVTLPCLGPCEVLSAWPLWSAVATGCLLHSTSNPGSRPQKRKFGSLKWRGCSLAIYRAL